MTVLLSTQEAAHRHRHVLGGFRDEITTQNGVLYKGSRVIIPKALQKQMLARTHQAQRPA